MFNPTLIDDVKVKDYDIKKMVDLGLLPGNSLSSNKYKFVVYNSNLTVQSINFTELSFLDFSSNALFFLYFG